ncbi:MAG TPA: DUF302 domain-containing protein [Acidimicrobiales bacterium]|nr:DUF302 domain-containing protein [Acidimicrobiales bacterium]
MRSIDAVIDEPLDRVEEAVRGALATEGFGVLTEIDVAATFEAKLGVHGPPMKILGACNPTLAHRALELDPAAALVLPCNVVLREDDGRTSISIADPRELMAGPAFSELAADAAARLTAALARLTATPVG